MITKKEIIIVLAFFLLMSTQFALKISDSINPRKNLSHNTNLLKEKVASNPFENLELEALSAIVVDMETGDILFEKNSTLQLPLASLAKIMTAIVAMESGLSTTTISKEAILSEGDEGLLVGEEWETKNLASFTLVSSSNDGAKSLASAFVAIPEGPTSGSFVEKMNEKAKILNLNQTYFLNESGLDVTPNNPGAFGSSKDIARLIVYGIKNYPDIFGATGYGTFSTKNTSGKEHRTENTNKFIQEIYGVRVSKTGFTDLAGGNLALLVDVGINHPVSIVVMGSSLEGRFMDVIKLREALGESYLVR